MAISQNFRQSDILIKPLNCKVDVSGVTSRLYIRSYNEGDYKDSVLLYGNKEITKYFDHGMPRAQKEIDAYLEDRGKSYFNQGLPFGIFSVFIKDSSKFIGQVDLVPFEKSGVVEIGWIFKKDFHGKGYCTEAVKEFLLPLAKKINSQSIYNIEKLMATAHPDNVASNRVIKKLGMKYEKEEDRYNGKPRLWYSINLRGCG